MSSSKKETRIVTERTGSVGGTLSDTAQRAGRAIGDAAVTVENKVEEAASGVRRSVQRNVPAPAQLAVGACLGGFAGYMDTKYIEPFGYVLGGSLLTLQVLDHEGVISLPWNGSTVPSAHSAHTAVSRARIMGVSRAAGSVSREVSDFVSNNIYLAGGFTGAYFVAQAFLC